MPHFVLLAQAAQYRSECIFNGGRGSMVRLRSAGDLTGSGSGLDALGVGVSLYMRLVKYFGLLFAALVIVNIPVMYITLIGHRRGSSSDVFTLSRLSLGNAAPSVIVFLRVVWCQCMCVRLWQSPPACATR